MNGKGLRFAFYVAACAVISMVGWGSVFRRGFYFVLGLWYNLWRFRLGATLTGNTT